MDDRLRLLQYLYGEHEDDAAFKRRLAEDEVLRREYERLRETKERLDRSPSHQPDSAVVDRVVDEARAAVPEASPGAEPAADRSPRAPTRTWSRRLQTVSAALALLLVVGLGWWQLPRTFEESSSPTTTDPTAQRSPSSTAEEPGRTPNAVPAWDDSDELVRIHRRIDRLRRRTDGWGTLQTVGQHRP